VPCKAEAVKELNPTDEDHQGSDEYSCTCYVHALSERGTAELVRRSQQEQEALANKFCDDVVDGIEPGETISLSTTMYGGEHSKWQNTHVAQHHSTNMGSHAWNDATEM
jgi:uncharacterized protein with gpF-like domain